jgi:hypothetical protein
MNQISAISNRGKLRFMGQVPPDPDQLKDDTVASAT